MNNIDVVVPWVCSSDSEWQKEYIKVSGGKDIIEYLYRDWDWMRYWFRAVEKNVPWARKIHFVTCGHLPLWLNKDNPKLNIVKHSDYIPKEYLPVFSAIPIELNLHRIEELSEQFVYCNDDFFFIGKMKKTDYFRDGLPCDHIHSFPVTQSRAKNFNHLLLNNMVFLNRHFKPGEAFEKNPEKWINPIYTEEINEDNRAALRWDKFVGIKYDHMPLPLLKSKLNEIWNEEPEFMDTVSRHAFPDYYRDVNIYICRFWCLAQGQFVPYLRKTGTYCKVSACENDIVKALNPDNGVACLNDAGEEIDFEHQKKLIYSHLEKLFPKKSSFEI